MSDQEEQEGGDYRGEGGDVDDLSKPDPLEAFPRERQLAAASLVLVVLGGIATTLTLTLPSWWVVKEPRRVFQNGRVVSLVGDQILTSSWGALHVERESEGYDLKDDTETHFLPDCKDDGKNRESCGWNTTKAWFQRHAMRYNHKDKEYCSEAQAADYAKREISYLKGSRAAWEGAAALSGISLVLIIVFLLKPATIIGAVGSVMLLAAVVAALLGALYSGELFWHLCADESETALAPASIKVRVNNTEGAPMAKEYEVHAKPGFAFHCGYVATVCVLLAFLSQLCATGVAFLRMKGLYEELEEDDGEEEENFDGYEA